MGDWLVSASETNHLAMIREVASGR
jgi:hypothetical protein